MKKHALIMTLPLLLLLVLVWTDSLSGMKPTQSASEAYATTAGTEAGNSDSYPATGQPAKITASYPAGETNGDAREEIVSFATSFIGTPYVYAGMNPEGFDCSGFITYVYQNFGVALPHSSGMQAEEGTWVNKSEANVGDLVIFTGTNPAIREPGHVGIVISEPGDTIEFVHSSSNGGVKVSKVQGSRYDIRFLEIRRVL